MKIRKSHESIMVTQKRFGYFPEAFLWRGKIYRVISTEECRTVSKCGLFSRVERSYFRVRCAEGIFELFQDVLSNTWHVEKVMSARARAQGHRRRIHERRSVMVRQ
jgi:hypothetical protein